MPGLLLNHFFYLKTIEQQAFISGCCVSISKRNMWKRLAMSIETGPNLNYTSYTHVPDVSIFPTHVNISRWFNLTCKCVTATTDHQQDHKWSPSPCLINYRWKLNLMKPMYKSNVKIQKYFRKVLILQHPTILESWVLSKRLPVMLTKTILLLYQNKEQGWYLENGNCLQSVIQVY